MVLDPAELWETQTQTHLHGKLGKYDSKTWSWDHAEQKGVRKNYLHTNTSSSVPSRPRSWSTVNTSM